MSLQTTHSQSTLILKSQEASRIVGSRSMPHLPTELWCEIIQLSANDRPTLTQLRRANKFFAAIITPLLFRTITTWMSSHELERLKYLAKKRHLGRLITQIVVRPWILKNITATKFLEAIWDCNARTYQTKVPDDITFANFKERVLTCPEPSDFNYSNGPPKEFWQISEFEEKNLRRSRTDYLRVFRDQLARERKVNYLGRVNYWDDLNNIFAQFPNLTQLSIRSRDTFGFTDQRRVTTFVQYPVFTEQSAICGPIVIEALATTKARLQRLEVDLENDLDAFDWSSFCHMFSKSWSLPDLRLFEGLEKLTITGIDIDDGYFPSAYSYPRDRRLPMDQAITKLLSASPLLQDLTLRCSSSKETGGMPLSLVIPEYRFEHMRSLELHLVRFSEEELTCMLGKYMGGLQVLKLSNATLLTGTWQSVSETLRNSLQLRAAKLSDLWFDEAPDEGIRSQRFCFAGYPDHRVAGCLEDYLSHRIDFNPLQRASEVGEDELQMWAELETSQGLGMHQRCCTNAIEPSVRRELDEI